MASDDRQSMTIYDAATMRLARTLKVPVGTSLLDMAMFDGGIVLAPLISGVIPATGPSPWDQPGTIRMAMWGPGDTTPRSTILATSSASREQMWFGSALSPDNRTLLIPNAPGVGQGILANLHDGTSLALQGQHSAQIQGGAFSPDGSLVATSGDDGATRVWDVKTGVLVDTYLGQAGRAFTPAFSSAGGHLTVHTVGLDGTMIAWDVSGSRRLGEPFHAGAGFDGVSEDVDPGPKVSVSPDGRLLATNDRDGMMILDAATHAIVHTLSATQPDGSFNATWSPDGTRLAVAGTGTEMVNLYDTATWRLISPDGGALPGPSADRAATSAEITRDPLVPQKLNIARAVAFSPDSKELVAGGDDGTLWRWEAGSGAPAGERLQLGGPILDVAFNPVSSTLAVAYVPWCRRGRGVCTGCEYAALHRERGRRL